MMHRLSIQCGYAAVLAFTITAACLAGQTLPKPSAAVSALPAAPPTELAHAGAVSAAPIASHRVDVSFSGGKLSVDATNGSLNEILRQISQKAGIKITGSVADDRVFGHYGPASPAVVLNALLDGTGTNVLLMGGTGHGDQSGGRDTTVGVSELILTSRHGGVTPPNPNAAAVQQPAGDSDDTAGQYVPPIRPYQPQISGGRTAGFTPNTEASPTTGSDPADGGGPKTPQQIYDQLQRVMLQQQKQTIPPQ